MSGVFFFAQVLYVMLLGECIFFIPKDMRRVKYEESSIWNQTHSNITDYLDHNIHNSRIYKHAREFEGKKKHVL